jgi:hypothetical protein
VAPPPIPRPETPAVRKYPPERRRPAGEAVVLYSCCCCCCCCLHTLGGLAGAGVASIVRSDAYLNRPPRSEDDYRAALRLEQRAASEQAAVRLYWLLLLGVLGVGALVSLLLGVAGSGSGLERLLVAGFIGLLGLPAVQLATGILTVLVVALGPEGRFPDKGAGLVRVGKILLGLAAGTGIGVVVMIGVALLFAAAR